MSVLEVNYRFAQRSSMDATPTGAHLFLAAAQGDDRSHFLKARCLRSDVTAKALCAVSEIAGSRFYPPLPGLEPSLGEADPVVSVGPNVVRIEGFSMCSSAYIRLDLDDDSLDVTNRMPGAVHVDFRAELRAALAQMDTGNDLHLSIASHVGELADQSGFTFERNVALPVRWIKGFGHVQAHMAGMRHAFGVTNSALRRFVHNLPHAQSDPLQWVSAHAAEAYISAQKTSGGIALQSGHRLRVIDALIPLAEDVQVYANDAQASTAWVFRFKEQRLTLVLNGVPRPGFADDGRILAQIGKRKKSNAKIRAHLHQQDRVDADDIFKDTGLSKDQIDRGLALLASMGIVGFDLEDESFFHRLLPFGLDQLSMQNSLLQDALALLERGAVSIDAAAGIGRVASQDVIHIVQLGDIPFCTCAGYAKHQSKGEPCEHILAVEILESDVG